MYRLRLIPGFVTICQTCQDCDTTAHGLVIIGGTVISIDRIAADRPFYSGKHEMHGMNCR
ncbi:hypothetical protein Atai01_73840 [Amycolatopsis taiwanensis]|uniref:Uncharacterized protein n=1 Tax=Amycolatopsis taiwanensis TaxID=342230 RepID=A0A9W6RB73_9PSEU|nr:hypothetical protein Atai01_73840 [Amycolatopsis taiwanensis]